MNTVTLLLEDGRRIFTTEERVESWLQTRKNLHKEGDYLIEESEETEVTFNKKVMEEVISILNANTPAANVLKTIVNEYADIAYQMYPANGLWVEKLKHIATKGCGYNLFPELVSYRIIKKVTKARIIK